MGSVLGARADFCAGVAYTPRASALLSTLPEVTEMKRYPISLLTGVFATCALAAQEPAGSNPHPELAPPVRLEAAGAVIDTPTIGHAAPFVGDFDGDGVKDLLVGQGPGFVPLKEGHQQNGYRREAGEALGAARARQDLETHVEPD